MVKAQKIIGRKALTLGVILSIGFFGSISNAGPKQSTGLSDFGGVEGGYRRAIKAATDNTAAVARAEEVKKELEQNPGNTAAAQELQQINRGVDQRSQQTYGDADRFKDDRQMQQLATNVANTAQDWPHMQAYADRWAGLAKPDSPEWAKAVNTGGLAASRAGDFKKAEASALRVLEKFPKDPDALSLYHASKGRGKAGAATAAPASAPALAPAAAPAPNAYNSPQYKELASRLARVNALNAEAAAKLRIGDKNEALRLALAAQAIEPTGKSFLLEARVWVVLDKLADAIDRMGKAIDLMKKNGSSEELGEAYWERAKLQNMTGKKENAQGAINDATEALKINEKNARAWRERGLAYEMQGDLAAAEKNLRRAAEFDPTMGSDVDEFYKRKEKAAKEGAPQGEQSRVLQKAWTRLLEKAGGGLYLFVGSMGALLFSFAGYVLWFAKEGSTGSRVKRFFTPPPAAGQVIGGGRYEVREILGRGGMGTVNEGWDKELGRLVAVKSMNADLLPDADLRRRFVTEGMLVAQLRHPNIVDVYAIFDEPSGLYIVFAYVKGRTLHDLLNEAPGRRLDPAYALELGLAIAKAIDYAHSKEVIHRDLKPGNVMIDEHGQVKVMDFGIARRLDSALTTMTKVVVGTPAYMAPEQAWGVVTKQSDQYSFGVMMYESITGLLPFNGTGAQHDKLEGRFTPPSQLLPSLASAVDDVFKKVLHPDYKQRYEANMEFLVALRAALRLPPLAS